MNRDLFVSKVLSRLPSFAESDRWGVINSIEQCLNEGWSEDDTVAFMRCTEEINPTLDEDTALARMEKIGRKYKLRDLATWQLKFKK